MQLPLRLDPATGTSLQQQIFEQIRRLILDDRLRPGARMPSTRTLAADLRVSRNTVVLAFGQLAAEGFVAMRAPVGVFVAECVTHDGPAPAPADDEPAAIAPALHARLRFRGDAHIVTPPLSGLPYDFWVGRPDARLFPAHVWGRLHRRMLQHDRSGIGSYSDPAGLDELRAAIAQHAGAARGVRTSPERVIVTCGIQQGLNILARLFVEKGTPIAVEDPCYCGAARAFASYGARLVPVPVDADGADVGALAATPAFVYLTPSHQYPTGATMPLERRRKVLEWARRADAYVVEDDYDSDFHYDTPPLPALQSLDAGAQVIYLGTFSKCLAAGLRIGYLVVPEHLVESARRIKALLDNCSPSPPQVLLAEFIRSGAFAHHLRRLRTIYRARRDCLLAELAAHFGTVDIAGAQAGMHVAWRLPEALGDAAEFARRCRARGVGVYDLAAANVHLTPAAQRAHRASVVLGYAALDEREIAAAVRRMAEAADGGAAHAQPRSPASRPR